jgi:uncharacterized protein YndB with AHSA1/START domain
MKKLFAIIVLIASINANGQVATTTKKAFSRTTTISTEIKGTPTEVWNMLTNTDLYPAWNTTLVSFEGKLAEGEKINVITTIDTTRTFTLKVKEFTPNEKMVWAGSMGERIYKITETDNGVLFNMTEKIGGAMFPLFAKKIPSFDASFEQFTKNLKGAVEAGR